MNHKEKIRELAAILDKNSIGELRLDSLTRHLYSTDASGYRILPSGVFFPRNFDDVSAVISMVNDLQIPVIPRGGGTSLSGQAIGSGLIIDHSKYLHNILHVNTEERWSTVEAGVELDKLNREISPYRLMVGPDPASSASATLGGMIGNNSSGSHSILFGMTIDHIPEIEVVLSNGERVLLNSKTHQEVSILSSQNTLKGSLYKEIHQLINNNSQEIKTHYPKTWRNVAGYNLNRLLENQLKQMPFSLAPLIVGSEGTLACVLSAKVNLVPLPGHKQLMVLHFNEIEAALELVASILDYKPAAVELLDDFYLDHTRKNPAFRPLMETFISGEPSAILLVEFWGQTTLEVDAAITKCKEAIVAQGYRGVINLCKTPVEIQNVFLVRKKGLGLLLSKRGDAKPTNFIDDATVPISRLVEYTREVRRLCQDLDVEASICAHASAGCLHISPIINLKTRQGQQLMRLVSESIAKIAIDMDGTTTGEHGEGLARSYFNQQLFGTKLHNTFRRVKKTFDPNFILNPGKIVNSPEPWDPKILRYWPGYKTPLEPIKTYLDFSKDGGFGGLIEMCNGQGVCRKVEDGIMCPTYMITRDESKTTRGRANTLRGAITGEFGTNGLFSKQVYEMIDLCLACKACKSECPSIVDMAKLKYEYLAQYQETKGTPIRSLLFAYLGKLFYFASKTPQLMNKFLKSNFVKSFLEIILKIDRRRTLPQISPQTFQDWFYKHTPLRNPPNGKVILWDDCYMSFNEPETGIAAVKVLEAAGYEVIIESNRLCCGRPMISKGLLKQAKKNAKHNLELLIRYTQEGIPIVGVEPSCVTTFRDEYPNLVPGKDAQIVANNSFFIEEFLIHAFEEENFSPHFLPSTEEKKVLVHTHCYQKSMIGSRAILQLLNLLPNTKVEEILSGCCGMAGAFGFEKEHYDISMKIGEDRLFPAIRGTTSDVNILAGGISCRQQIRDGTGRDVYSPIQFIANYISNEFEKSCKGN